jgi:hypothetical protein
VKKTLMAVVLAALFSFPLACTRDLIEVPMTAGTPPTPTPTAAPVTITMTIQSGTLGAYSGFYYAAAGFANDPATGYLSLTAQVGDSLVLPAVGGFHPLSFDDGTATCIYSGVGTDQTYSFLAPGTYYFHCEFHGQVCSPLNSCGHTNCVGMAGEIVVSP